jgi:hypothetical protein
MITLKDFVPHREMQFQPVEDDDDDISKAIQGDADRQDDKWQLTDDLDSVQLDAFWDDALKELGAEEVEQD